MIEKQRDPCILLLDDCFDSSKTYEGLTAAGFTVERFTKYFPRTKDSLQKESSVKDDRVISLCAQYGFLLVTTDHEMKRTFAEELKATNIGVIATANNQDGVEVWINAFKIAKTQILRDFKKQERPYFSTISKNGRLNTESLINRKTRRTRPSEKEHS